MNTSPSCLLYCHCAHAQVVPAATKQAVLEGLARSGQRFEAVADLCEMSARKDPSLARHIAQPGVQIIACHRRAVHWLLHAAGSTLPAETVVHNMRANTAEAILAALSAQPTATAPAAPVSAASESAS